MKILDIKLTNLVEYENNPRRNDDAVVDMANTIRVHGFRVPILVRKAGRSKTKFTIADGHLRLKAARHLDMETIPAIDISDMPEAMVASFRISVNKAAELAEWDMEKLATEIDNIQVTDEYDMSMLTGMDDGFLAVLQGDELPIIEETVPKASGPVEKSADRSRVKSANDKVKLTLDMTAAERDAILERLDALKKEHGLETRSEALIKHLTPPPEPRKRARGKKPKA